MLGRASDNKLWRNNDLGWIIVCLRLLALQNVQHKTRGVLSNVVGKQVDGGECGCDYIGIFVVIVAHNGNILGDAYAVFRKGGVDAAGNVVAEAESGGLFEYTPKSGTDPASATVFNVTGAALPQTGGSGTDLIYLTGILLIGLSGVLLLRRRFRRI